jgi:hypothetical protein
MRVKAMDEGERARNEGRPTWREREYRENRGIWTSRSLESGYPKETEEKRGDIGGGVRINGRGRQQTRKQGRGEELNVEKSC